MNRTLLLLASVAAFSAASISQSVANTPPVTTHMGAYISLSGMRDFQANGNYWNWSSGSDGMLGWLKQNPDGSSEQLIAHFNRPGERGRSSALKSLVHYNKSGFKTDLFPSSANPHWVLSWVGENYTIFNRNLRGTHYGSRGIPGTIVHREFASATTTSSTTITVQMNQRPTPPLAGTVGSPTLGSMTVNVSSNLNVMDLELVVIVDDAKGKTMFTDSLPLVAVSNTAGRVDYPLQRHYLGLPDGQYVLNFELRNRRDRSFVEGVSEVIHKRTNSTRL